MGISESPNIEGAGDAGSGSGMTGVFVDIFNTTPIWTASVVVLSSLRLQIYRSIRSGFLVGPAAFYKHAAPAGAMGFFMLTNFSSDKLISLSYIPEQL
ncbi:MAG: hypothetical protein WEA56_11945 [Balneolaceae bacterium]